MSKPPARTSSNTSATPVKAPVQTRVAAASEQMAQQLIEQLQTTLGSPSDWLWHADTYATLHSAQLNAGDAILLLAPPLGASNGSDSDAQTALMQTRQYLVAHGWAFQLLFSQGPRLLDDALTALCNSFPDAPALQARRAALREHGNLSRWSWSCEKCSDPECELRLFKGLLNAEQP